MPLYTSDTDEVYVGRIRQDIALDNGISMWVAVSYTHLDVYKRQALPMQQVPV